MKNIILAISILSSAPAMADKWNEAVASICDDAKEISYASYINSQQGVPKSTTLVRVNSIYATEEKTFKFMSTFVELAYDISEPPINKSLEDAGREVSGVLHEWCIMQFDDNIDRLRTEDKVGM